MNQSFRAASLVAVAVSVGLISAGASPAHAEVIEHVTDFASSYYSLSQSPSNLVNDSYMDENSGDVLSYKALPDGSANGMWHAGAGQGSGGGAPAVADQYVVFDLGQQYNLTDAYLWQMMQTNLFGRGIKTFELYGSPDAPTVTAPPAGGFDLSGFTQILSLSTLNQDLTEGDPDTQTFTLSNASNIRQVYLKVDSAWSGQANEYVGLSEIKFEGTPIALPASNWISLSGGTWETPGNWDPNSAPDDANTNVNFNLSGANPYTVTLSTDRAVHDLSLAGTASPLLHISSASLSASSVTVQSGAISLSNSATLQSSGTITINSGGGLSADASAVTAGSLAVNGGPVYLANGATLITSGDVATSSGTITVDGKPSKLTVGGDLALGSGGYQFSGTLNIINGGVVELAKGAHIAAGLYSNANAAIHVSGQDSALTSTGSDEFVLGRQYGSVGSLAISAGGSVHLNSGLTSVGDSHGTGSVTIDGKDSTLTLAGALTIGDRGGVGTLTLTNGGLFDNWTSDTEMGYAYASPGSQSATLTVGKADGTDTGGTLFRSRLLHFGSSSTATGILNLNPGGTVELRDGLYATSAPNTRINLAGGTLKTPWISIADVSYLHWTSGDIQLTGTTYTSQVGGSSDAIIVPTDGTLAGTGNWNNFFTNLGTIAPGDDSSMGKLWMGTLTVGDAATPGTLAEKIDLTAVSADLLQVGGDIHLDHASLILSLLNVPDVPTGSLTFLLVDNQGVSAVDGLFSTVNINGLSGYTYTLNYAFNGTALNGAGDGNDIAVTFRAVPEPADLLPLLCGMLLLPPCRRRRSVA